MRKFRLSLLLILISVTALSACRGSAQATQTLTSGEINKTVQVRLVKMQTETAAFQTAVVAAVTERAPTATITFTPVPPTVTPTITLTPEPVEKDIWTLQDECDPFDPRRCVRYTINNSDVANFPYSHTGRAIHVSLIHVETGEKGYFVIGRDSISSIKLFPGEYRATYYLDCDEIDYLYRTWNITERTDAFYCKRNKVITYRGSSTY
jgi:hypothetical protein